MSDEAAPPPAAPKPFKLSGDSEDIDALRKKQAAQLPEGFKAPPPPDYAPNLPYDRFTGGVVCFFDRTRTVEVDDEMRKVHVFADSSGEPFEIWGTAALDAQLYTARRGDKLFLKYDGKQKLAGARSRHNWTVGYGST